MAKKKNISTLSVVHPICAGIDVHKELVVVTLITRDASGQRQEEVREFSAFTDDLFRLRDWLISVDCSIIAIESTGVYWRPVHNVLEGEIEVVLVNARHYKNVPGRKTDVSDSQWLAQLLEHGLLRGSYIPPSQVRQWRDLTRLRRKLVKNAGDYQRRIHKLFESANIKIDSVVSELFGATGRNLMRYLIECDEPTLAGVQEQCRGILIHKAPELYRSIQGFFNDHHRFQLRSLLHILETLEGEITALEKQVSHLMGDHQNLLKRLDAIPGINQIAAQSILGELGVDLKTFRSPQALASWAGVSPGNNESAGKRRNASNPAKKHLFREMLVEMAWAAVKKKNSFWKGKYYRLKARRGAKKAIVAIAHKMLKVIYFILKEGKSYQDLGEEYFSQKDANRLQRLKGQAKQLGFELVAVTP
jgi:transposase|tara:strand:+ start:122 stop:1375 length:1254 start_codon:yes stop_codon:yes gene_type:complete